VTQWAEGLQFARWSLDFLFVDVRNSLITCGLLLWATVTLIWVIATQRNGLVSKVLLQFAPLIAPTAIIALGVIYACEGCGPSALGQGVRHHGAEWGVNAILVIQLVGAALLTYAGRGARLLAVAVQTLALGRVRGGDEHIWGLALGCPTTRCS
jgi:hypothetical protein